MRATMSMRLPLANGHYVVESTCRVTAAAMSSLYQQRTCLLRDGLIYERNDNLSMLQAVLSRRDSIQITACIASKCCQQRSPAAMPSLIELP